MKLPPRMLSSPVRWFQRRNGIADRLVSDAGPNGLWRLLMHAMDRLFWQDVRPGDCRLPSETPGHGPLGSCGFLARALVGRRIRAAGRMASSPFGSLVTLTVGDTYVRALAARGNKVRFWASADLPEGTVRDGEIIDPEAFATALAGLFDSLHEGARVAGSRVPIALTGRNLVQARFSIVREEGETLEEAVLSAMRRRMAIRPDELVLDWHASPQEEPARDAGEPAGSTSRYDVYAVGLYRNVLETNLKVVTGLGAQPVDLKPKALALAAAVNEPQALILDLEPDIVSVIVVRDGLPEVVRDLAIEPGLPVRETLEAIHSQIALSVQYYDSLNPASPLDADTPLFVTGARAADRCSP